MLTEYKKSVVAGALIGLSGFVFLSVENPIIGAFLFALGLFTILVFGLNLFTGKVGNIIIGEDRKEKLKLPIIWFGNFIGAMCTALFTTTVFLTKDSTRLASVVENINPNYFTVFVLSISCGVFMALAANLYKKTKSPLAVIMPVMAFILSGSYHSVAFMYYLSAHTLTFGFKPIFLLYILIISGGNILGGIFGALSERVGELK